MNRRFARFLALPFCALPFAMLSAQQAGQQEPKCEDVFKNIKVFRGVPADDLIPAMEFMSAAMNYKCTDCHDPNDYAKDVKQKEESRKMVLLQRDINNRHFNGRLEVTCFSCHHGKDHPEGTPIPAGVSLKHEWEDGLPSVDEIFAKAQTAMGGKWVNTVRTGTLTAPNDVSHKPETKPLEFIQAAGGKFRIISGDRKIVSNGTASWYGEGQLGMEPAAIFWRIGRAWHGPSAFTGLSRSQVTGVDKVGGSKTIVVRGIRATTSANEELHFDAKTNELVRLVNLRASTIGTVVSSIDYSNYKVLNGAKVPMKVVFTFADNSKWTMDFKTLKTVANPDRKLFEGPVK